MMKKFIAVFAFLILLTSCNESKIAYLNVEKVLQEYNGSKAAQDEMQKKSQQLSSEMEQMGVQFQAKVQEYQKNRSKLSEAKRAQKEQELMQEQQMIQQRQQMVQQQFQKEGNEKIDSINNKIEEFIKEYAQKNNYTFVLGTSSQTKTVLYGKESSDITDLIIEKLNNQDNSNTSLKEEKEAESPSVTDSIENK